MKQLLFLGRDDLRRQGRVTDDMTVTWALMVFRSAVPSADPPPEPVETVTLVEKGLTKKRDYDRGRRLFGEANCFACHRFDNEGGSLGPDLTSVAGRFSVRDLRLAPNIDLTRFRIRRDLLQGVDTLRRDVDREFDADRDFGMHDPVGIGLAHSDAISKNRRRAHRFF